MYSWLDMFKMDSQNMYFSFLSSFVAWANIQSSLSFVLKFLILFHVPLSFCVHYIARMRGERKSCTFELSQPQANVCTALCVRAGELRAQIALCSLRIYVVSSVNSAGRWRAHTHASAASNCLESVCHNNTRALQLNANQTVNGKKRKNNTLIHTPCR